MPALDSSQTARRGMRAIRETFARFFNERGTHLAAMVAYFALMSFVPLVFLALSILGFLDQADSSSALVEYLEDIFPEQSVESIVDVVEAVQRNAATLSAVGAGSPPLELALALLRARVGVQHHVRPAEPAVPARQGARDDLHDERARRPLHRPRDRDLRLRPPPPVRDGRRLEQPGWRSS